MSTYTVSYHGQSQPVSVDEYIALVDRLMEEKDWFRAWDAVDRALTIEPDNERLIAQKQVVVRAIRAEVDRELNRI
jgi:hypothetical protein